MNKAIQNVITGSLFTAALMGCSAISATEPMDSFTWVDTGSKKVLANAEGMTLYTFDKDSAGKSNCYGQCATLWPPALATESDKATGKYSKIDRKDGSQQWAYNGQPLYTWINDTQSGQTTGDGVKGVWHIVTKSMGY